MIQGELCLGVHMNVCRNIYIYVYIYTHILVSDLH